MIARRSLQTRRFLSQLRGLAVGGERWQVRRVVSDGIRPDSAGVVGIATLLVYQQRAETGATALPGTATTAAPWHAVVVPDAVTQIALQPGDTITSLDDDTLRFHIGAEDRMGLAVMYEVTPQ